MILSTMFLQALTASPLINVFLWILIIGAVFYLLWWLVGYLALPTPFDKILRGILAVAAVVILINFLLGILGKPF